MLLLSWDSQGTEEAGAGRGRAQKQRQGGEGRGKKDREMRKSRNREEKETRRQRWGEEGTEQGTSGPGTGDCVTQIRGQTHPQRVAALGERAELGAGWVSGPCHSGPCFPSNPDTISQ